MPKPKSEDAFVLKRNVRRAVTMATLGQNANDNQIASFHHRWNSILVPLGMAPCDFKESQSKSGCRLPICPRCALRARMRLCLGVLSWHWHDPAAQMSLLEYRVHSRDPTHFMQLFERPAKRAAHGRARDRRMVLGNILTTAYAGRTPGVEALDGDEKSDNRYWAHRQLTVFWHEAGAEVARVRGRQAKTFSDGATWSEFQTLDDLAEDEQMSDDWCVPNHAGRLIVGGLLRRFDRITGYLVKDIAPAVALISELRGSGRRHNFVRLKPAPGRKR